MLKTLIAGTVAVGLIVAPTAAVVAMSTSQMSTHHKTHKMHHAQNKMKMAPGTTTGMAPGTTTGSATSGGKAKTGY